MTGDQTAANSFWEEMAKEQFRDFVYQQVFRHWQFSHNARSELLENLCEERMHELSTPMWEENYVKYSGPLGFPFDLECETGIFYASEPGFWESN